MNLHASKTKYMYSYLIICVSAFTNDHSSHNYIPDEEVDSVKSDAMFVGDDTVGGL